MSTKPIFSPTVFFFDTIVIYFLLATLCLVDLLVLVLLEDRKSTEPLEFSFSSSMSSGSERSTSDSYERQSVIL